MRMIPNRIHSFHFFSFPPHKFLSTSVFHDQGRLRKSAARWTRTTTIIIGIYIDNKDNKDNDKGHRKVSKTREIYSEKEQKKRNGFEDELDRVVPLSASTSSCEPAAVADGAVPKATDSTASECSRTFLSFTGCTFPHGPAVRWKCQTAFGFRSREGAFAGYVACLSRRTDGRKEAEYDRGEEGGHVQ